MISQVQTEYRPDFVSPPGETLLEVLEERGITQAELALRMGRPTKTINEIIHGKAMITPATAIQLERALGIPAEFWNSFERRYRESLAQQEDHRKLEQDADWLERVPWRSMVKKGWIRRWPSRADQLREILQFFGVASPTAWHDVCGRSVYYRRAPSFKSDPAAVAAWLRQGQREAATIDCAPYDNRFRNLLPELRSLTLSDPRDYSRQLVERCAAVGVAVVFVPELPGTRLCGAAQWLSGEKALIQLSLRYKTEDSLWFSFFHEAGHVVLHGRRDVFVDFLGADEDARETEANQFAASMLIPPADFRRFVARRQFG